MDIWEISLKEIENILTRQSFENWFRFTKLHSFKGNTIEIGVSSTFLGNWLKNHFIDVIKGTLKKVTGIDELNIDFIVCDDLKQDVTDVPQSVSYKRKKDEKLNPKYTFSSFVVGPSNQFAHASTRAVADSPGKSYNPLFIYSGVGLGKTHLLHAIGNHIISSNKPNTRILYVSSEQFTNEVIQAILNDKTVELRNKYRNNTDVLLIDDIQFIAGKERTVEEFFHTFNTLYEAHKQIVITSDRFPKDIQNIDERLRSRFEWGLLADIQPPDLETRIAIIKKKAAGEFPNLHFPDDVALFLAENIKTNVREIEGALVRLGAFSSLTGQELTLEMAKRVFKDLIRDREEKITIDKVQKVVSTHFNIKISDLKSKKRTKSLVTPRQIGMFLSRELLKMSFPEIGRHFGGKDHSTVIYACNLIEKNKSKDTNMGYLLEDIIKKIKEGG
ncbi:MAG: chromosomal replication initiation protein DnaA [Nitrospirae bacterium RIFCSPLOWO2_02_42_7]|nr:MAG: chromosomal replication initiation protein DnaA [Nitrospirae bacterium RIFCSPLOWO2_02_42_7]HAS16449.1 chromosomal replication initiator protein DnaA [Nitrospiraceae bacterium]